MTQDRLRVVSTKIPMALFSKLANDADRRGVTVSFRVNEILTAHYSRYPANGLKPNGQKKK